MKLFDNRNWYGYNSKNWLLKKVSFFVMYKKRKRKMGNGKFYDSFT